MYSISTLLIDIPILFVLSHKPRVDSTVLIHLSSDQPHLQGPLSTSIVLLLDWVAGLEGKEGG